MKIRDVYRQGKKELKTANIEDANYDSMCLFEHCFGLTRQDIIINGDNTADEAKSNLYFSMIKRRKKREPLQYILGYWFFMDLKFYVGDGVLIPREDTEVLVYSVLNTLSSGKNPTILDLCAGSGAIGVSLADKIKDSRVYCVELSKVAFKYLLKNIEHNKTKNVTAINADIFDIDRLINTNKLSLVDAIVSNPPYISEEDMKVLQKEVQKEPELALYGGEDGLDYYRFILKDWSKVLKSGGIMAVEIGIGQQEAVMSLFRENGITGIKCIKDINNIYRVVMGIKS